MWDLLQIVKQVLDAGATIRVIDFPFLDLTALKVAVSSCCSWRWLSESA